jgi:hypothetical protein
VTATAGARQREARERRAAEVAERFTGWSVWVTAQGSPVATRSGGQRPPEPYDGDWAQTVIADGWDELETELAAQARYDRERVTNQTAHGLQYASRDTCRPCLCIDCQPN